MEKKFFNQGILIIILVIGLLLGMIESNNATSYRANDMGVEYYSHIQDIGWEEEYVKKDGEQSGTTGQNKKLEAIKINLKNAPQNAKIEYQAHIENIGWQNWMNNTELAGTTGKNLRMEAIRIRLVNLENYSVRYRTHVQDIGWQEWVEDGQVAGTTGRRLKIEAIEIEIISKEEKADIKLKQEINNKIYYSDGIEEEGIYSTNLENSNLILYLDGKEITNSLKVEEIEETEELLKYSNGLKTYRFKINMADLRNVSDGEHTFNFEVKNEDKTLVINSLKKTFTVDKTTPHIIYSTHIENIGWQTEVEDGKTAGTTGRNLKMEAIKINIENLPPEVKLEYQTHVQDIGWQNYVKEGEIAGTTGRNLKTEAIKIKLTGTSEYSVEYRAHVQDIGWQDWIRDGEIAGTTGQNKKLEAIEIRIVKKEPKAMIQMTTDISNTTFYTEKLEIKGWYLANIPNTILNINLDNENINSFVKQNPKDEVYTNYESFGGKENTPNPEFQITLPKEEVEKLSDGKHTLEVTVLKDDGINKLVTKKYEIKIDKTTLHLKYSVHMQDIGWMNQIEEGQLAGDINKNTKIEAIKIEALNITEDISLQYKSHVQDIGWENEWTVAGMQSGTTGKNKKIEAIRIKLNGTDKYSVAYRVYADGKGWQDWAYDGEYAGTVGENRKLKAIEIKIVPKVTDTKVRIYLDEPAENIASITNENHLIKGWAVANVNSNLKIYIDNQEIKNSIERYKRTDVINEIKGYGGDLTNENPGFRVNVDFGQYSLGNHTIKVQLLKEDGTIIQTYTKIINIKNKIVIKTGTYGISGLKVKGDARGSDLTYYQYGSGPNVFFATFCVHGFEDAWGSDGTELTLIANEFWNRIQAMNDENLANKWTIYIFPEVNPDGRRYGWTNNGPGRTTLFSQATANKGVDINRTWSTDFKEETSDRYYTGSSPFQAYEAMYLRDFLLSHKSQNGQTILVDLHGWFQQLIGDGGVRSYYKQQFPDTTDTATYGKGYLINWARANLGTNGRTARSALIELPAYIRTPQDVKTHNLSEKYIAATLSMLRGIV